jgi:hypothetical protein
VAAAILALITAIRLASTLAYFFKTFLDALANLALATLNLANKAFFSSGWACFSHNLTSATLWAAFSLACNAYLIKGCLAFLRLYSILAILAFKIFVFLPSTVLVRFLVLEAILTSLALAALSCALMAAFFALGASASFFLRVATLFWALS